MHGDIKKVDAQIGRRLQAARLKANYSMERLSGLVDVTTAHLVAVESGEYRASAMLLARTANVLGLEIRMFFSECCSMQHESPVALIRTAQSKRSLAELIRNSKDGLRAA